LETTPTHIADCEQLGPAYHLWYSSINISSLFHIAAPSYLVHNPSLSGPSGHDSLTSALPTADSSHILHNQGSGTSSNNNNAAPRPTRSHVSGGAKSAIPIGFVVGGTGSSKRDSGHQYNYRIAVAPAPVAIAPAPVQEKRGNNGSGKGEGHTTKRHRPSTGGKLPVSSVPAAVPAASSIAHNHQRHSSIAEYHSSGRGSNRPNQQGPPQGQSESEEDEDEGEEEDDENEDEDEDDEEDHVNGSATLNHHTRIGQRAEPLMDTPMNDDLDDYGNGYGNDYGNDLHEEADPRDLSSSLIQPDTSKDPSSSSRRINRLAKNFVSTLRPYSMQQQTSLETQTKENIHSVRSSSLSMAQSSSHRTSFGGDGGSSHNNGGGGMGGGGGAVGGFLGPSGKPLIVPSQVSAEDRVYLLRNLALEEQRVNVEVEKIALEREKLALERTRLQWEMRKSNLQ